LHKLLSDCRKLRSFELETLAGKSRKKGDSNGLGSAKCERFDPFGFQSRMITRGNQRSFFRNRLIAEARYQHGSPRETNGKKFVPNPGLTRYHK
jgi:hypothetical protein